MPAGVGVPLCSDEQRDGEVESPASDGGVVCLCTVIIEARRAAVAQQDGVVPVAVVRVCDCDQSVVGRPAVGPDPQVEAVGLAARVIIADSQADFRVVTAAPIFDAQNIVRAPDPVQFEPALPGEVLARNVVRAEGCVDVLARSIEVLAVGSDTGRIRGAIVASRTMTEGGVGEVVMQVVDRLVAVAPRPGDILLVAGCGIPVVHVDRCIGIGEQLRRLHPGDQLAGRRIVLLQLVIDLHPFVIGEEDIGAVALADVAAIAGVFEVVLAPGADIDQHWEAVHIRRAADLAALNDDPLSIRPIRVQPA